MQVVYMTTGPGVTIKKNLMNAIFEHMHIISLILLYCLKCRTDMHMHMLGSYTVRIQLCYNNCYFNLISQVTNSDTFLCVATSYYNFVG